MTRANFLAAVLMGSVATSVAMAQTSAVTDNRVTIHHIGPFTGQLAGVNKESTDGAKLYFDTVNAKGGVSGRQIDFERIDDKQDPKETARIYKELIEQRKILTLFMPRTTPSIEAALPISQDNAVPMIAPQTGGSAITAPFKKYVFAIRATYQAEVERAIELQHSVGIRRFAFLAATDAFGTDVMKGAERAMAKLNLKPVAIELIDNRKPDISKALPKILELRPDTVVLIAGTKPASDFVKGYVQQGGYSQFVTLSNNSSSDFVAALERSSRGVIVMQVLPSPYNPTTRVAREFLQQANEKKVAVSYAALQGYISAKVLVEGLRRAGRNLTSESLTRALEGFNEFDTGDYVVEFDRDTRLGSTFVEATIISSNGRFMR